MPDELDLIQQAAQGSKEAQLGLVDLAIAAGAAGAVRQIESLAAAETWARLAAANGGREENRVLVGVLLTRGDFEASRSAVSAATWYEGEARRVLMMLAEAGDEDAQLALQELGPARDLQEGQPAPNLNEHLVAAGSGEASAFRALYEFAAESILAGRVNAAEALVAGELYARLGMAAGDYEQAECLSAILVARAQYERELGCAALADAAAGEAAIRMAVLADQGNAKVATWLAELARSPIQAGVVAATEFAPTILKYMHVEGTC